MINAAEAQRVRTDGGRRAHIPATVRLLCVCVRAYIRGLRGLRLLKVDGREDCSHQHLGSEWPLKSGGIFDGPSHEGMLLALPPHPLKPPALWNAVQAAAAAARSAGMGLDHVAPSSPPPPPRPPSSLSDPALSRGQHLGKVVPEEV